MSKSLLGKFSEFGILLTSTITGFVTGMLAVFVVDSAIGYFLVSIGFVPLTGIAGFLAVSTLTVVYGILYLYIAIKVSEKVDSYLSGFQSEKLASCTV